MATAIRTAQVCRNFINGQWVDSRSGRTRERRNPANVDEVVAIVPLSTREETREAVAAAKAAFPAWRDTPAPVRGRIIAKAAALMTEQKDDVARILTLEEGKTFKESLVEVQRAINILEFMAGEGRRPGDCRRQYGGAETCGNHVADRCKGGRNFQRGRIARGRVESRPRPWQGDRGRTGAAPRCARLIVHRIKRNRRPHLFHGRAKDEKMPVRNGWEES